MSAFLARVQLPSWVKLALLGLIIAALWVQTARLGSSQATVEAQGTTIETLRGRVDDDARKLAERDRLIGVQNKAVEALAKADETNQAAYRARIAAADLTAKAHDERARAILAATPGTDDRCEAAFQLITHTLKE